MKAALAILFSAAMVSISAQAEEIGSVSTVWKLVGPNHKIIVEVFDDPDIPERLVLGQSAQDRWHQWSRGAGGGPVLRLNRMPPARPYRALGGIEAPLGEGNGGWWSESIQREDIPNIQDNAGYEDVRCAAKHADLSRLVG